MRLVVPVLVGLVLLAAPARAQQPVTRADSADVLVGTAERLAAGDADDLAAALARLVQRRYGDTPAAARASAVLAALSDSRDSRAGRVGLVSFTTIYGAWLGAAVPAMLDAESPEAYGLGLLLGGPVGFFAGRAYAQDRSVSAGDAGVITWSGLWGTWQGAGWMLALGDDMVCDVDVCYDDGPDAQEVFAAMVAGGLAGIGGSMLAADRVDIEGGTATMIGWGSLWGTGLGVVIAYVADLDQDDDDVLLASLVVGDVGFASMAVLAPRWDMSSGRAWLVNAAGVMGGAIGAGVDLLVQPEDEDIAILIPTVGAAVGLGLAAHLTRDMDVGRIREGMLDPDDDGSALLRLRDGDWRVALPQPAPVLLREHARDEGELGMRVQLLHARF